MQVAVVAETLQAVEVLAVLAELELAAAEVAAAVI